jgi:hypothetical protein
MKKKKSHSFFADSDLLAVTSVLYIQNTYPSLVIGKHPDPPSSFIFTLLGISSYTQIRCVLFSTADDLK